MNILAALKQEERKIEGQLNKLQKQLNGIRIAAKALGNSRTVSRRQSENLQSRQETVGKIQIAGEKGSSGLICSFRPARIFLGLELRFLEAGGGQGYKGRSQDFLYQRFSSLLGDEACQFRNQQAE
jgi:hypothetical protein